MPAADQQETVALIMAGGGGTRFWPRSRQAHPKQFLSFSGTRSLLSETVERLAGLVPEDRILVITGQDQRDLAQEQTGLPADQIIGEPHRRDTAACIGLGILLARRICEHAVALVLPADHLISPRESFQTALSRAVELAAANEVLVTIGLRPHRPATGYGYIETDEKVDAGRPVARKVVRFLEKPDLETARRFVLAGRFLWNSGMLVFQTDTMLAALKRHLPDLHTGLLDLADPTDARDVARAYEHLPRISIDFGVLEKSRNVVVVEADFEWDDVGTFEAVARHGERDAAGNLARGEAIFMNCSGNLVENAEPGLVLVSGVSDVLVVRTKDAIMVIPRKDAERVKDVVRHLEEQGGAKYL